MRDHMSLVGGKTLERCVG